MNKTMQNMMKPIPVNANTSASLRQQQEDHVLNWLNTRTFSVTCTDVAEDCGNIPGVNYNYAYPYRVRRTASSILKRLERKGHVVSVLCGSYRYYSVPVEGGAN